MNSGEMINRLHELNNRLALKDTCATLYVYGGFVMCFAYELRETTMDIDCIHNNYEVEKIAKDMEKELGLEKGWLNTAVKDIVQGDMYNQQFINHFKLSNLDIVIPSPEQMLAMKLYSARYGTEDFNDAVKLALMQNITSRIQLYDILKAYFKEKSIRERNKYNKNIIGRFIEDVEHEIKSISNRG